MNNFEQVTWTQLGVGEQFYFWHGESTRLQITGPYTVKDKANGHYTREGWNTYNLYLGASLVRWIGEGPGPDFFTEPKVFIHGGQHELHTNQ